MITIQRPIKRDIKDIQQIFYETWLATYPNEEAGIIVADIEERFKDRFSEKSIQEFKEIYFKKFGQEIDDQRALELAINLINLYKVVYKNENYGNEDTKSTKI